MGYVLNLLILVGTMPFASLVDRAFTSFLTDDWASAAAALDEANAADSVQFQANNFHYLRGRIAENQNDWTRALQEFTKVGPANPLYAAATWHAARAAAKSRNDTTALEFLGALPADFPLEFKLQLARETGGALALRIYQDLSTREARFERASAGGHLDTLWTLIREDKEDDVALESARIVSKVAMSPEEEFTVADVFLNHRHFDQALPHYEHASTDPGHAAEARYQIGRIHYLRENYAGAIDTYRAIAKDFEGTDWAKDAEYQIASCYWRLADYRNAEKAYLEYIQKYGREGFQESATRNLVDVYRVLGENQKAISLLDRALAGKLSVSMRQVFVFTKAKVLFTQKRYAASLALFQQLGRMRLRSAPGGTTSEEVQYFQALCMFHLGNKTAATTIWRKLAREGFSYYSQRSAEKIGKDAPQNSIVGCRSDRNPIVKSMESNLASLRHPPRTDMDSSADLISELVYLQLWDEAASWLRWSEKRIPTMSAAEFSYLGGHYDRSITLANRLPRSESTLPLVYPAGYHRTICESALANKVDPLWLHAIIWQESKYDPRARSGASARGLMQFIPETAQAVGKNIGRTELNVEDLYDPTLSIELGAAYWSSLMQKLRSPEMALAAYNGGPDNAQRWLSKSSDPELFVADIGFVETKKYVMAVFAARAAYASLAN